MPYLGLWDWVVVGIYFALVFTVAFWPSRGEKETKDTSSGYFLAGRNVGWFVIGASLFASNVGSEHLVGLAGTGASSGVAVAQFELLAAFMLLLLGWVFVPFYLRSGVFTMPEFLQRRYSPAARWYLALISIVGYVLTKISVTVAAGGIVFESIMGISFWTGALIVVVATGVYTVLGGLRAVLYTDMLQMFVLIGGAVLLGVLGLTRLGGPGELYREMGPAFFDMWKPMSDPAFPWTGILFGAPILGVWYWCTDQFIVQRVLSARNQEQARKGTLFAGYLKVLPLFIFVFPGIIAAALAKKGLMTLDHPDQALPNLIANLLPTGLRGIAVAGLLAALMSSLSSVFNSTSTLITWDIYRKWRPQASERHLVAVGQGATVVLVVLGLAWIPLMRLISGQLYQYLQSVQAYIAPPIAAVFLLGIFIRRLNARGAMAALWTGFVVGIARLIAELNKGSLSGLAYQFADINFLHFAFFLFVLCSAVLILASFTAPAPSDAQVEGLGFFSRGREEGAGVVESRAAKRMDLGWTLGLFAVIGVIWIVFSH